MCLKELREALRKLSPMISEKRKARIASVVASRTNSLAVLLENVHNEANESAVMRSMDALGCLHLHKLQTIPTTEAYIAWQSNKKMKFPPRTDAGARAWVQTHHWSDTRECIAHLKDRHGYTLASACPSATTPISGIDFSQKVLVAFGNESTGISDKLADLSDLKFSLPMCGFVDSYNISVSVALTLYHAYLQRRETHVRKSVVSKMSPLISELVAFPQRLETPGLWCGLFRIVVCDSHASLHPHYSYGKEVSTLA